MKPLIRLVLSVALALATYALFAHGNANGFVSYDDPIYVTDNPELERGLSADGVRWSLTTHRGGNWHPVTWWTHLFDYARHGATDAGPHHRTSAWIHALTAALLVWALYRLSGRYWPSLWVAAVFALHPLRVESVTWIAERKDVVAALFWVLCVWSYAHYARAPGLLRYVVVLLSMALCLMSKSMGVTLPAVFLLFDFWPLERHRHTSWRRLALEKLPLLALSVATSLATYFAQAASHSVGTTAGFPISHRFANAARSYGIYLRQMFWPRDLACFYPHPSSVDPSFGLSTLESAASIAGLALISFVAWRLRRRQPYLLVGWCLYLGVLVPAIGLLQVGAQGHADRYTYLPSIGIALAIAWWAADFAHGSRSRRRVVTVLGVVALVASARLTWDQIETWRDSESLYRQALASTEDNYVAENNLGLLLEQRGELEEAEEHYRRALESRPSFPDACANLAKRLMERGELAAAGELLERSLAQDPQHVPSLVNLGVLRLRRNEPGAARDLLERALDHDPRHPESLRTLAQLYRQSGNPTAALGYLERWLELEPDNVQALRERAACLNSSGQLQEARVAYGQLLAREPGNLNYHLLLATIARAQGDNRFERENLEAIVALDPEGARGADARADLVELHLARGEDALALPHLGRLHEHAPEDTGHAVRLAWLLATSDQEELRDQQRAVAVAEAAVERTKRTDAECLAALAAAWSAQGKLGKAAKWQRLAIDVAPAHLRAKLEADLLLIEEARPVRRPKRNPKRSGSPPIGRRRSE